MGKSKPDVPHASVTFGRTANVLALDSPTHLNETDLMPTALAEWTTERPDVPGFYWWRDGGVEPAEVVNLWDNAYGWRWYATGSDETFSDDTAPRALWWPVRLDPPPVG